MFEEAHLRFVPPRDRERHDTLRVWKSGADARDKNTRQCAIVQPAQWQQKRTLLRILPDASRDWPDRFLQIIEYDGLVIPEYATKGLRESTRCRHVLHAYNFRQSCKVS